MMKSMKWSIPKHRQLSTPRGRFGYVCVTAIYVRNSMPTLSLVPWLKHAVVNTMALSLALHIEYNLLGSICCCALLQAIIIRVNSTNTAEPMDCLLSIFESKTLFRKWIANSCAQFIFFTFCWLDTELGFACGFNTIRQWSQITCEPLSK